MNWRDNFPKCGVRCTYFDKDGEVYISDCELPEGHTEDHKTFCDRNPKKYRIAHGHTLSHDPSEYRNGPCANYAEFESARSHQRWKDYCMRGDGHSGKCNFPCSDEPTVRKTFDMFEHREKERKEFESRPYVPYWVTNRTEDNYQSPFHSRSCNCDACKNQACWEVEHDHRDGCNCSGCQRGRSGFRG